MRQPKWLNGPEGLATAPHLVTLEKGEIVSLSMPVYCSKDAKGTMNSGTIYSDSKWAG